jgi:H+-translocating NAD(P) transhydrogenase subunit beta
MFVAAITSDHLIELAYMAAAVCFVVGIKMLGKVRTANQGNNLAALGMAIAIAATALFLLVHERWDTDTLRYLPAALLVGSVAGYFLASRVPMTAMPEFVAFFNGLGGAASMCVALAEVPKLARQNEAFLGKAADWFGGDGPRTLADIGVDFAIADSLSILIGAVTFSGSMIAYAKLAGKVKGNRWGPLGETWMNVVLVLVCIGLATWGGFFARETGHLWIANGGLVLASLVLGMGLTLPIGGADMPVAIALLNSYSGIAGMTTGFVLRNNLLIVAGSLVGASGIILTQVMCKAMNRSLKNVLLGVMGDTAVGKEEGYVGVKSSGAEELAPVLAAARSVIIVPGYGMAVAQAQHKVRELDNVLTKLGCDVRYAIHPVAGRMPGHMNILLAEADVPYEKLKELDAINAEFKNADVALVLGANDVCNPAAEVPGSPIHGMPVLEVWNARTVIVVKRSLGSGYAGIKNPLFERANTQMLFADAKKALEELVAAVKAQ